MSKATKMAKVSAKGVFNLFWGLVASSIISALGVILVAGFLSPSEYGLVAIALIGPNLITIFRDWGMNSAIVKYSAQYRSEKRAANVKNVLVAGISFELFLGLFLSIISFFLSGFLATNIFDRPNLVPLIQIASLTVFADALLKTAQSAFTGYEKMEYHSVTLIVHSTLKTGFMTLLVILGFGVFGAIIGATTAYLIAGSISIIILYLTIYKKLNRQKEKKMDIWVTIKTMFRYGFPLSISAILLGFLAQFYNFLIAIYSTDLIMGNYQVALNFAFLVTFFVEPVIITLFPAFSKLNSQKEQETLGNVFQFSVKYAAVLIVPAAFAVVALSQPAVSTFFGEKYSFAPLYLALFVFTFIYTAFGNLSAENLIKSQGKTDVNLKLSIITSVIGLSLNLVLIPKFGILGLLATNLAAGIPSLIIGLWWIKRKFNATIDWTSAAKILLVSTLTAIITHVVISQLYLASWIKLTVGALIFLVTYLTITPLIGAINKTDVQNLKEVLKGLGPLAPLFTLLLRFVERLTHIFSKD